MLSLLNRSCTEMKISRFFCTAMKNSLATSDLAILRKKTGQALVNCRKALEECNNDLTKAEKWLRAEAKRLGWEKVCKLQDRTATEGLVAVTKTDSKAVMVEVNCETDFVAKNDQFKSLVEVVVNTCLTHANSLPDTSQKKVMLFEEELSNLMAPNQEKLSDIVAKNVGVIGERIILRRAMFYNGVEGEEIDVGIHPPGEENGQIQFGRYGSFIAYKKSPAIVESDPELGPNLCKHIIGMNPKVIGDSRVVEPSTNQTQAEEVSEEQDVEEDEEVLILQEFMMDPEVSVGEVLDKNGVTITEFERFGCGEQDAVQENVKERVAGNN